MRHATYRLLKFLTTVESAFRYRARRRSTSSAGHLSESPTQVNRAQKMGKGRGARRRPFLVAQRVLSLTADFEAVILGFFSRLFQDFAGKDEAWLVFDFFARVFQ